MAIILIKVPLCCVTTIFSLLSTIYKKVAHIRRTDCEQRQKCALGKVGVVDLSDEWPQYTTKFKVPIFLCNTSA